MLTDSNLKEVQKHGQGFVEILKVEWNAKKENCKTRGRKGLSLDGCAIE